VYFTERFKNSFRPRSKIFFEHASSRFAAKATTRAAALRHLPLRALSCGGMAPEKHLIRFSESYFQR
jgi:hypothetical protein